MHKVIVAVFAMALGAASVVGQSPSLRIVSDDPNLPADLFYGSVKVKPLRLRPGTNIPITIDDTDFFVNQTYVDLLNRFPEPGGFTYWVDSFNFCGTNKACIDDRRVRVSAAFFVELEFQETGYVVYRFHRAAFGTWPAIGGEPAAPNRANLKYSKFKADRLLLAGGTGLAQSTVNYASTFVQRTEFLAAYPNTMTNDQFVNALFDTASLTGSTYDSLRQSEITEMNSGKTRAQVMLSLIEISDFKTREYNPAWVLMQYFGYLRRDAEQGGYDFWLNVVNNQPGVNKYLGMVCAFITAAEFQLRFGSAVTHTNAECGIY